MRRFQITMISLCAAVLLAGPHVVSARSTSEELATMNETLANLTARWGKNQQDTEARLKEIDEVVKTIRRNQAELLIKINELATTISVSEGRVAENVNALQSITQQMTTLNNRIDLLTKFVAGDNYVEESKATAANPTVTFDQAREDYLKQRYDLAIQGFRDFITTYGDDPRCGEAQYWIAESYYSQEKYKEAIAEFRRVTEKHADAPQATDALLKVGFSLYNQKNYKDAETVFKDVVQKYPNTRQAKLAEERLALIKKKLKE